MKTQKSTRFSPASGPATGSFNGLHPKRKFLAAPTFARPSLAAGALAAGALVAGVLGATSMQAGAASISVTNHSFETVTGGVIIANWSDGFSEATRNYGGVTVSLAPIEGALVLGLNNNYGKYQSSQTTGFSVTSAGQVLQLTVGVGNYSRPGFIATGGNMKAEHYYGTINLMLDGIDVATNTANNPDAFTPTAPATSFGDATLLYTTTSADIGKFVGIHIDIGSLAEVGAKAAYFDNVRLDVTSVPEPTTGALVAAGLMLMARRRRGAPSA